MYNNEIWEIEKIHYWSNFTKPKNSQNNEASRAFFMHQDKEGTTIRDTTNRLRETKEAYWVCVFYVIAN